jgi:hypothetical protein
MATFERSCSVEQCFNFKKDVQSPIGVINTLIIGATTFTPDLTVTDPSLTVDAAGGAEAKQTPGAMTIVGALETIKWELGDVEPIELGGVVSVKSKQMINALLFTTMVNINLTIGFTVYDYDELMKKYFVAFSTGNFTTSTTGVQGLVKKDGNNLNLTIDHTPFDGVQSPKLYKFTLSVVPAPMQQLLYLAASDRDKVTKTWGRVGPTGA